MALSFFKQAKSPIHQRIQSDDASRLRLKYDTYYHIFEKQEGTRVWKDGKEFIMLSSNDYLGLTHHPKIKEAGKQAIEKWGASTTGARLANGGRIFHRELEEELAEVREKLVGVEIGGVLNTGLYSFPCGLFRHVQQDLKLYSSAAVLLQPLHSRAISDPSSHSRSRIDR